MPLFGERILYSAMVDNTQVVYVLYALPDDQAVVEVEFEPGLSAMEAVVRSGLVERYPEIGGAPFLLGVWGVEVRADCSLRAGDRVEISRPLAADPRDMRRDFVSGGRVMGGASVPEKLARASAPK